MSLDAQLVQQLFLKLIELPPNERAAALESIVPDDLRPRLEALLQAHEQPNSYLDPVVSADNVDDRSPDDRSADDHVADPSASFAATVDSDAGTFRGATRAFPAFAQPGVTLAQRYTLLEKIGEGGMGEVWVARQSAPVKRRVAIKLIKAGMDSRLVLGRFEQERQALAMMDHPNIARVLDGGMTESGHPYFVMELVNGLPLTQFCDQARLNPTQRMELFIPICKAVQHAHQKGIVHRDLKPANILVTLVDGQPIPKVIDFGVAKAIGGDAGEESLATQFGAVVGTLEYMSPEQAGFSAVDVDSRADIYSLGIVLYELLTGLRPIDAGQLKRAGIAEMMRVIREQEPSRPSTRCTTDASFPSHAALRGIEPKKLTALLRGELDWVIMKCLEKQRDRRYDSAAGLARDIQRILANEPVEARPPSTWYRMRKLLMRHKGPAIAISMTLAALLIGTLGTTAGLIQANQQRRAARDAEQAAAKRAASEREAKEELAVRLSQVEKNNELLLSIFANLNPEQLAEQDRPLQDILAENLGQAIDQLQGNSVGDPSAVMRLQQELGHALVMLGQPEKGIQVLQKAVETMERKAGPDDPLTWILKNSLAGSHALAGQTARAIALHQDIYQRALAKLGPEHPDTIRYLANLGAAYQTAGQLAQAEPLLAQAVEQLRKSAGPDAESTLLAMNNLATTYDPKQQRSHAIPLLEEAYRLTRRKMGPDHLKTLLCMTNLAAVYQKVLETERARPLLEDAFQRARRSLGPDHPQTLHIMTRLAELYRDLGLVERVLPLLEQETKLNELKYGLSHEKTLDAQNRLAAALWSNQEIDRAISLLEDLLRREEVELGRTHPSTLVTMMNLGSNLMDANQPQRALPLLREAYSHADAHPRLLESAIRIATLLAQQGQWAESLRLLDQASQQALAELGEDSPLAWDLQSALATQHYQAHQLNQSIPIFESLLTRQEANVGRSHPVTLKTLRNLAINYQAAGRHPEAVRLFRELLDHLQRVPNPPEQLAPLAIEVELAQSLVETGESYKAIELLERAIDHDPSVATEKSANTTSQRLAYSTLAHIHWSARRLDQSIPLYRELLRIEQSQLGNDHPDTLLTRWNLATNYRANQQLTEAIEQFEHAFATLKRAPHTTFPPTLPRLLDSLVQGYDQTGRREQAIALLEEWFQDSPTEELRITDESVRLRRAQVAMYYRTEQPLKAIPLLDALLEYHTRHAGRESPQTIQTLADLAVNHKLAGQPREAIKYLEEVLGHVDRFPYMASTRLPLADCYYELGEHAQVVKLLPDTLPLFRAQLPPASVDLANVLAMFSLSLLEVGDATQAEPLIRECLKIRELRIPESWSTGNATSMLGDVLLAQEKFAEAEPLLLRGYEAMNAQRHQIPAQGKARLGEAIQRLIRLYQRTDRPEEARRWQEMLGEWKADLDEQTQAAPEPPDTHRDTSP